MYGGILACVPSRQRSRGVLRRRVWCTVTVSLKQKRNTGTTSSPIPSFRDSTGQCAYCCTVRTAILHVLPDNAQVTTAGVKEHIL